MKKLFLLFLILTGISYSQTKKEILIGNWKATDHSGVKNKMVFSSDGYVSMTINGEFIDGKNFVVKEGKNKGQKGYLKYETDDSKTPLTMDIVASGVEKGKIVEKGRLLAIVDFIDNDHLKINLSFNQIRASEFNEDNKESTIFLQRDK